MPVEGPGKPKAETDTSFESNASASITPSFQELKSAEENGEHMSISEEQLVKAIERAVKAAQGHSLRLDISIHKQTEEVMVKVIDKDSGKVIREVPPEKKLDLLAKLWEMAGILVDERR
nr:flagellar protein FlaG [Paenibacillus hamazuiensis]